MNILLVYNKKDSLKQLQEALEKEEGLNIHTASTIEQAVKLVGDGAVEVAVLDEEINGQSCIDGANALVKANALVNCALVSKLDGHDFHEATEGLGILMPLTSPPTAEDAANLLEKLKKIGALMTSLTQEQGK